jgi:hypothetical protein
LNAEVGDATAEVNEVFSDMKASLVDKLESQHRQEQDKIYKEGSGAD